MLKIKSKAILAFTGLMVAAFVLLGAVSVKADMVSLPSAGVSKSSSAENVKNLQSFLNWTLGSTITPLVVDGKYGAKTTAAIKLFQGANGLVADGSFGPKSSAKAAALQASMSMGGATYPAGCASSTGFSSTTGMPCASGTYPAGCMSNAGFSPTTGMPCNGATGAVTLPAGCATASGFSSTTGQACTATTVSSGTNGYLADIASDSTNRVSTVYESEQDKVVAGFRATARLSSQTVTRVRVQMRNTDTGGSSINLANYITGASLWYGSTRLATMAVTQADRSTSNDTYTFNFSGINANIAQDQIGRFYVSVSVNGSLDTNDANNANWAIAFPDGGLSASSPDGSYDTYNASSGNVGDVTTLGNTGFTFGKFAANGVKATVGLSVNNPSASVVTVSNTSSTNGQTLLKFTVQATNSALTLRRVPIQVISTGNNVSTMINTIKLYNGANLVDSLDGSAGILVSGGTIQTSGACTTSCGFIFSNLATPYNTIASGTTTEFSVVVDLKSVTGGGYAEGNTLTVSLANADALLTANFGVLDTNGNQLSAGSTYRIGSAVGQIQTLRVNGVNLVMGTPSVQTTVRGGTGAGSADIIDAVYTIPLSVTSFGQTVYAGQVASSAATAPGTTGAGAVAVAFGFNLSSAPGTLTSYTTPATNVTVGAPTLSSTDATVENLGYRLDAGTTKHFTIKVEVNSIGATAGAAKVNIRVALQKFATWTDNALSTGQSIQSLLPIQSFQTDYTGVTAN